MFTGFYGCSFRFHAINCSELSPKADTIIPIVLLIDDQIPAVECRNVSRTFGSLQAVRDVTLRVPQGQCLGILGPNGAGKTTLVEMLEGLQVPDGGEIRIFGRNWRDHRSELQGKIGLALQDTQFMDKLTVLETARLFASLYALPDVVADTCMQAVGLWEKRDAMAGLLSGGQKQKLALAVALIPSPKLLILDEPTTGLDPAARRDVWGLVRKLTGDGVTIILTSHYMDEVENLCDWIVIMSHGKILAEGTVASLIQRYAAIPGSPDYPDRATLDDVFVNLAGIGLTNLEGL